jgi:hypothetical protein
MAFDSSHRRLRDFLDSWYVTDTGTNSDNSVPCHRVNHPASDNSTAWIDMM